MIFAHLNFKYIYWLLFAIVAVCDAKAPRVTVKNGTLEGFRVTLSKTSASGPIKEADIFLGIPYARPPVEDLRLQKPQPALNWSGVRDATAFGPPCIPVHFLTASGYSEDCLVLNVFRPAELNKNATKYPVLVFIHGGGFNVGGNFVERFENVSDNFVSQGLVVVTLQYRLGFFGFFSDGTPEFPGNYGLWDQRQALLWIQENIEAFGGDAKHVTLWGHSAAAASVSMLSLSRHSRDLFHQVIQQSGSSLSPWALNEDVVEFSKSLVAEMGCNVPGYERSNVETKQGENNNSDNGDDNEDDESAEAAKKRKKANAGKTLRDCLHELEHEDVLFALSTKELIRGEFNMFVFNPRWDSDFFDIDFIKAIRRGSKKPSLLGFNTHEAAFLTLDYGGSVYGFRGPMTLEKINEFGADNLIKFVYEKIYSLANVNVSASEERKLKSLRNCVAQFYAKKDNTDITRDFHFYTEQYTLLLTDIMFVMPIVWEARMKAQNGWPVYLFQFDYSNPTMFEGKPFNAITHGAEYPYTIGVHIFGSFDFNDEDQRLRRFLVTAITNFVKQGNPSTEDVFWPTILTLPKDEKRIHGDTALKTLRLRGSRPHVDVGPKGVDERLRFWDELNKKFNFARVSGLPTVRKSA